MTRRLFDHLYYLYYLAMIYGHTYWQILVDSRTRERWRAGNQILAVWLPPDEFVPDPKVRAIAKITGLPIEAFYGDEAEAGEATAGSEDRAAPR